MKHKTNIKKKYRNITRKNKQWGGAEPVIVPAPASELASVTATAEQQPKAPSRIEKAARHLTRMAEHMNVFKTNLTKKVNNPNPSATNNAPPPPPPPPPPKEPGRPGRFRRALGRGLGRGLGQGTGQGMGQGHGMGMGMGMGPEMGMGMGMGTGKPADFSSISLPELKKKLLEQLKPYNMDNPENDETIINLIKDSDYLREFRRSQHKPTIYQKMTMEVWQGIIDKIMHWPVNKSDNLIQLQNNEDINRLIQGIIAEFAEKQASGIPISAEEIMSLVSVLNQLNSQMAMNNSGGAGSGTGSGTGASTNIPHAPHEKKAAPASAPAPAPGAGGHIPTPGAGVHAPVSGAETLAKTEAEHAAAKKAAEEAAEAALKTEVKDVAVDAALVLGGGGRARNINENPNHSKRYIQDIKNNRRKLYRKEMEIINSVRNFNNNHNQSKNNNNSNNKHNTTRKLRNILRN